MLMKKSVLKKISFAGKRGYIRPFGIAIAFALVGVSFLLITHASTFGIVIEPETSTLNGATAITGDSSASNGSYIRFGSSQNRRFFTDSVSWNKTASELGISTSFNEYIGRMFNYGGASGWDNPVLGIGFTASSRGQYNMAFRDYSIPIYDAAEQTTTRKLYWAAWAFPYDNYYECNGKGVAPCTGNQTRIQTPVAMDLPWNPNWKPGTGNDRMMMVINYKTGEAWTYYGTNLDSRQCTIFGDNGSGNWGINVTANPPYDPGNPNHICMAGAGRRINVYTIDQATTYSGRGMGIDKYALLLRAEEVKSGAIRHALALTIFNQMFGPVCSPDSPTTAGAGVSCAFHLAPATRVEHQSLPHGGLCGANEFPQTDANRSKTVPSGIRFRVNRDDTSINSWLDSRGYTGAKRNTARTIGKALTDYGFIAAAETGCGNPHFETDGMQNPETKNIWVNELGLSDTGLDYTGSQDYSPDGLPDYPSGDLMYGFITSTNLQVVNPQ